MTEHPGQNGSHIDEWNRRIAASREINSSDSIDFVPNGIVPLDESDCHWLADDPPWTWSAILTLLAALAAGGTAVWWFAA